MSYQLNKKIKNLVPYEPVSGTYNIRLDANECPLNFPQEIQEQIAKAVSKVSFNRYPDPLAADVIKAFSSFYGINPKNVTAGNGSDELISLIETAFLEKGDKILVALPDFSMYEFYSSICEVSCLEYKKNDNLQIDVDSLIETINLNKINMVIFSNPCNPTGQGMTAQEVKKLISSTNALIVLDEAYMDFWSESILENVNDYSNLIILRTASKMVGSAALRLGFAVANTTITNALKAVKSPYNVNSVSQALGCVIYNNKEYLLERQKNIVTATQKLYNKLQECSIKNADFKVYKSVANFVLVKTSFGKELFEFLKTKSIVIRFMGDYIRISTGTEDEVDSVIRCINEFLDAR